MHVVAIWNLRLRYNIIFRLYHHGGFFVLK
jgi:hypothetical protein